LQQVENVVGADGMLCDKREIFRKESEMNSRQRPLAPADKDGHPYILSDLVMVARINSRSGTESSPLSPLAQGSCWSPNAESTQGMLDGVEASSEGWDGTPLDINSIDWRSMGIMTCPPQQSILTNGETEAPVAMVYKTSPPSASSCANGADPAVAGVAASMQDLLNFITGDGPEDPHFRRQITGEPPRQISRSSAPGFTSADRMDDEEYTSADNHADMHFDWVPTSQQ